MKMRNWKTALLGLVGGIVFTAESLVREGEFSWAGLFKGVVILAIGMFAKDYNVTGVKR